jgi:hypothetical protein
MRILISSLLVLAICAGTAAAMTPGQGCEAGVASAVGGCVARVNTLVRRCYANTGAACAADDAKVGRALASLARKVNHSCPTDATAQGAGYGAVVTRAAVLDRAHEACLGEAATMAARTFGGPQAALLSGATPDVRACLDTAFAESGKLLVSSYRTQSSCIRQSRSGAFCNTGVVAITIAAQELKAETKVGAACPMLNDVLHFSPSEYLSRTAAQARCLTATAHGDSGPLTLDCGARAAVPVPPRGQWVKVTLDQATWGTVCGDGTPYAFWLRLAPSGSPAWRVVTDMQGGGVCLGENDCKNVNPGLFQAIDEAQPGGGYLSTDPNVNPFYDWTMLYMPYCTQDLHIGGGTTSTFSTFSVKRYGAIDARAALRYLRDVLWGELEASDPDGWHPDRLRVMFSGESAGGYGAMYNYHYPLDELRWVNTTSMPDSGFALGTLPLLVTVFGGPTFWNLVQTLPPYCTAGDCGGGPQIEAATAPRLHGTPWQQMLNLSNQVDPTQTSTTGFPNLPAWTNAVREDYCDARGQNGIYFFLPASSTPSHTMLRTDSRFIGLTAEGVSPRDYTFDAMTDPTAVVDRVDEGTLVTDYPGVNPFPCTLPPP